MTNQFSEIEKQIIESSKALVFQLRGNQAVNGNAIIDIKLINVLHEQLDIYKVHIENSQFVNKDIVGLLFYTCTRFYLQSKYSKNSSELIIQFEKLYTKVLTLYTTNL